jgi:hypothetical protein
MLPRPVGEAGGRKSNEAQSFQAKLASTENTDAELRALKKAIHSTHFH